jgi:6-hydroxycyclohex-1-ene-1-carbonyl-CoA dehydrogenase
MTAIHGWEIRSAGGALEPTTRALPQLSADEVLVQVAGCGVCHTDLGFLDDGVRTRHPLPLILGHEISGTVLSAGARYRGLVGRGVVVAAVIPCGTCPECAAGRPTICRRQTMPGNDRDGGFATHVIVPGAGVCAVPGADGSPDAPLGRAAGLTLRHLAVVADAVSTAYQAVRRAEVGRGDLAVVFGVGGVGGYAAQVAASDGAAVVGVDPDPRKLAASSALSLAIDPRNASPKAIRAQILEFAKKAGRPESGWKLLECSGTSSGQTTAFGCLVPGAVLMVVGFTLAPVELRLSNLMAFDARAIGNWGCDPALYPEIVSRVLSGEIDVVTGTKIRPLSSIAAAFDDVRHNRAEGRLVLAPDI